MFYTIYHLTRFRYSAPISESIMELRMQPFSDAQQRCHDFSLEIEPYAQVLNYRDDYGNGIHHFDIPGQHSQLVIKMRALVELLESRPAVGTANTGTSWQDLDDMVRSGTFYYELAPSRFAAATARLCAFRDEIGLERKADPMTVLIELNQIMFDKFGYAPQSTSVDSPIDHALETGRGVCQDFAHIMTALVRGLGIPCRYVSGYLFHRDEVHDRSLEDATHAWIEAMLPGRGWVGFDPTNNLVTGERHIRVAVGRDYDDVPPTRGVFKGDAASALAVAVRVVPSHVQPSEEAIREVMKDGVYVEKTSPPETDRQRRYRLQQQQQQQ